MTILLAKDLRLSLDAIRPWVVILLGLVAAAAGVSLLPAQTRPYGLHTMSVAEAIAAIGGFAGMAGVVTAAWIAATVAHGDGRHGAGSLSIVLPVAGRSRVLSKLLAIAVATAIVSSVAILLRQLAPAMVLARAPVPGLAAWLVAVLAVVGAALALGVAPLTRAVFPTVMIALLLALAGAIAGGLVASITLPSLAAEFERVADAVGDVTQVTAMSGRVHALAAAAGVVAVALVALVIGIRDLRRPLAQRSVLASLAVAIGLGGVAGAVTVPIALRVDPIQRWQLFEDRKILLASDDELITMIGAFRASVVHAVQIDRERDMYRSALGQFGPLGLVVNVNQARAIEVAKDRVRRLPMSERARSPLATALRNAEDYSSWLSAVVSLRLIPDDEPRKLDQSIDVVLAYPELPQLRRLLDHPIAKAGGWTNQRGPLPELGEQDDEVIAELDAALLGRIRTLRSLDTFSHIAERLDRLHTFIQQAAARPAGEAERSQEAPGQPTPPTAGPGTAPPSR